MILLILAFLIIPLFPVLRVSIEFHNDKITSLKVYNALKRPIDLIPHNINSGIGNYQLQVSLILQYAYEASKGSEISKGTILDHIKEGVYNVDFSRTRRIREVDVTLNKYMNRELRGMNRKNIVFQ